MNVIDAQDALDTIETDTGASGTLAKREKNAFERSFGEGTAFGSRPWQTACHRPRHLHCGSRQLISTGSLFRWPFVAFGYL